MWAQQETSAAIERAVMSGADPDTTRCVTPAAAFKTATAQHEHLKQQLISSNHSSSQSRTSAAVSNLVQLPAAALSLGQQSVNPASIIPWHSQHLALQSMQHSCMHVQHQGCKLHTTPA
jgi:hypothetical protein